jgi:peptide/nickel transport system ATP-binding protein
MSLLTLDKLSVAFYTDAGVVQVLDEVSFNLDHGMTLGLVGESGCGKSVTALSIMGLLPKPAGHVMGGDISFNNTSLLSLSEKERHDLRGNRIAMIFQEPMTALNPLHKIGKQLMEVYRLHFPEQRATTMHANAVSMLRKVGIPEPEQRMDEYPHQLSGGMRQRVMIAMALACEPDILIADEPTTALDVTIQAQILELMKDLQQQTGMAILFITHDLGVIAELCNEVVVMYAGRVAEHAPVQELFDKPGHPYTRGLLSSIPLLDGTPKTRLNTIPGTVPAIDELPGGCRFRNRCSFASGECETKPLLEEAGFSHQVACVNWRGMTE